MAKKQRAGAKPGTKPVERPAKPKDDGKVKASDVIPMPAEKVVQDLARRCAARKNEASEISGTIGEMIAKACEDKHLDRKAFSIVRALDAMSDKKLAITLPHLLKYIDDLGLHERAERQAEMFPDADADDDEEQQGADGEDDPRPAFLKEQTEAKSGEVVQIGVAARKVPEAAGGSTH